MALLMGLTQGFNKHQETKRSRERESILNAQAQQQIAESQERIARNEAATQRANEEAERAQKEEEATALEEAGRLDTVAELIVAGNPEITIEQARAMAPNVPADTVNRLLQPADAAGPDDPTDLDVARTADLQARTAEQELENQRENELRDLRNSQEGLRLRRNLMNGDQTGLELAITAATGGAQPLHSMEAVEAYLEEIQPTDDNGVVKLSDGQKRAAAIRGATAAEALIQQQGSLEAAIAVLTRQVNTAPSDDPFIAATQAEMMRELQSRFEDAREGGTELQQLTETLLAEEGN